MSASGRLRDASASTAGRITSRTCSATTRTWAADGSALAAVSIGSCTTSVTCPGRVVNSPFFITWRLPITEIGTIDPGAGDPGAGVRLVDASGDAIPVATAGYRDRKSVV